MDRSLIAAAAALVLLAVAPAARAEPAPFGHPCAARDGVRFCPTADDAARVPAWDGVPLDVDVTLPATGDGPFPALVMLHGLAGDKAFFQSEALPRLAGRGASSHARRGYAVITYSARGFGRSCGAASSRTPDCAAGWTHLTDQRYEARDTQHLLGLLVDAGIARPGALGVVGESGGSVQALQLAHLRNRIRLPSGRFAIWRSPLGRRLSITAAYATWVAHDLVAGVVPNGRFLDFRPPGRTVAESAAPLGVASRFIATVLGVPSAFVAPPRADPQADLRTWQQVLARGEPYGPAARSLANQLSAYHSAVRLSGTPAPLLLQSGWADDLFPVSEALRPYLALRHGSRTGRAGPVSLQVLDTGHARGGAHPDQEAAASDQAAAFLDAHLRRRGRAPTAGSVLAFTQTCPRTATGGRRVTARSWEALHPGAVRFTAPALQRVTATGGDPLLTQAFSPGAGTFDACRRAPAAIAAGTAVVQGRSRGFTLMGRPTVRAAIATTGPFGQLDSRLWDVAPDGSQTLVTRGAYRLTPGQRGTVLLQLNGNGYRFPAGHIVKLELLGSDAGYLRPSNGTFSVAVARVTLELPTLERANRALGVGLPILARPSL